MVQMDLPDRFLRRDIQTRPAGFTLTGDGDRPKLSSYLDEYSLTNRYLTNSHYVPDVQEQGSTSSYIPNTSDPSYDNHVILPDGHSRFLSEMAQDLEDECNTLFRNITTSRCGNFGTYCSAPPSPSRSPELFRKAKGRDTKIGDHNCLMHPSHISVLQKLEASKYAVLQLEDALSRLEQQKGIDPSQIEKFQQLEKKIIILEKELVLARQEHELDSKTIDTLKSEMEAKVTLLQKQKDAANKEKENMVMRFAISEKELLNQKVEKENLNKKLKEATKENESLTNKLKTLSAEKLKISQQLETKNSELSNLYSEVDKLKDEINARDIKIKWSQNKLKSQLEAAQKGSPEQIEKLSTKILGLQNEIFELKEENQDLKKQLDMAVQGRITDQKYKEQKAQLIMSTHEYKELEAKYRMLNQKFERLMEENSMLAIQTQEVDQERFEMNDKLKMVVDQNAKLSSALVELEEQLDAMDSVKKDLKNQKEAFRKYAAEIESLRKCNEELGMEMEMCRKREAELLEFTQRVTDKNVSLQSEFSSVEAKATELEREEEEHGAVLKVLKKEVSRLEAELKAEQERRNDEAKLLAKQVAEKSTKMHSLESNLTEAQSELTLLKNKYSVALKELQKELQHYRKRVELLESSGGGSSGSDSLCQESRTSSLSSLNDNINQSSSFQVLDVPAQILIERIVKLQQDNAKQSERVEFLEEHSVHLVHELQKKSKLLQNYILREQAGALTSKSMDKNKSELMGWSKLVTSAELTKHGGIMASLYSAKPVNESMSLELCMEINQKLQAILEDTLLKNITLKENIDTLGDEIARLTNKKP
ncbi:coiled-coil domain-containing protein 186-like isoform X1 [Cimex lectularius]|uniref:Uncharacterized protein n=1 Tax=Cimex lectularius TaxID=79782 RepID=A0A8I6S3G9_CIMLE|nr:coiled-coil domain-containing protein 186-like isoform X1 [Cimex lectularius]XP_014255469.1 coiled-coil domain-containing protein 186-like isoform X1 [Cimex lectularius]